MSDGGMDFSFNSCTTFSGIGGFCGKGRTFAGVLLLTVGEEVLTDESASELSSYERAIQESKNSENLLPESISFKTVLNCSVGIFSHLKYFSAVAPFVISL
jgi:hypothetical protein